MNQIQPSDRLVRLFLIITLLIVAPHRLPAPIQEIPENPTPNPTAVPTAKPKKSPTKPKSTPRTGEVTKSAANQQTSAKISRFAGTWVGTMPEVPWGNVATELMVDQTETTMEWQESGKRKGVAKAQRSGDTLSASFPAGLTVATWSLTAQPDGTTARVRLQAFMNDQTAIFGRVAVEPRAPKSAR